MGGGREASEEEWRGKGGERREWEEEGRRVKRNGGGREVREEEWRGKGGERRGMEGEGR